MKRRRTITYALTLVVGSCALAPAAATAGGPLLSGYGGPGSGAQTIIGATLLNGPGSGSSGSGGSAGGGSVGSSGGPVAGVSRTSLSAATSRGTGGGGGGQAANTGSVGRSGHGGTGRASGARTGSPAAGSSSSRMGAYPVVVTSAGASWFSGADLLALLLASAVLALVAVATGRLAATHRD